jgi:alkylated DNA repair protein (DNA oxidative demethylase)
MTHDLLADIEAFGSASEAMANGARLLRGRVWPFEDDLPSSIQAVASGAPFRHMVTAAGPVMSVAMTNYGAVGWVTDRSGYRCDANDPETARPWPVMPDTFARLATVAEESGYTGFAPDVWPNQSLRARRAAFASPGQGRERFRPPHRVGFARPAGDIPARRRGAVRPGDEMRSTARRSRRLGGPTRFNYRGVTSMKEGCHPKLGRTRINLTFRRAL